MVVLTPAREDEDARRREDMTVEESERFQDVEKRPPAFRRVDSLRPPGKFF